MQISCQRGIIYISASQYEELNCLGYCANWHDEGTFEKCFSGLRLVFAIILELQTASARRVTVWVSSCTASAKNFAKLYSVIHWLWAEPEV